MRESWQEMEARHAREREAKRIELYRAGLDLSAICGLSKMGQVNARIALKHGLCPKAIRAKGRTADVCAARHEAWSVLHKMDYTLSQIGKFYAGRDHTTIRNGLMRHAIDQNQTNRKSK